MHLMRVSSPVFLKFTLFNVLLTFLLAVNSKSMSRFSIKQAINLPALRFLKSVLRHPQVAVPNIELSKLYDLDFNNLSKRGVKYLVFDKDNTLT